jgi:hypothetical protein
VFSIETSGSTKKTESFLNTISKMDISGILATYGRQGVAALAAATPTDTGRAESSWDYRVTHSSTGWTLAWTNSDIENGFPVVIGIQYGHGTRGGGWVQGRDFINPAIRPIFDRIAEAVWRVVTSA